MTERATAQDDAERRAARRGPSTLYIALCLVSIGLLALAMANGLRTDGFSWWRAVGVFVYGLAAGFWVCELGPVQRWRARRFGRANARAHREPADPQKP